MCPANSTPISAGIVWESAFDWGVIYNIWQKIAYLGAFALEILDNFYFIYR